jgi:hypothetical protein
MSKKLTTQDFIQKSKLVHGNKYNYSSVKYINARTPVIIICPTHGKFMQTPDAHLHNKGCKYCADNVKLTTDIFIRRANKIHKNKYNYDLVNYLDSHTKVNVVCKIHGSFKQTPTSHLNGNGCPQCANKNTGLRNSSSTADFIKKACCIHNYKYTYLKCKYKKAISKVIITCPIHGDFYQRPNAHLSGHGCPKCSNRGWTKEEWIAFCKNKNIVNSYVYIIEMFKDKEHFIKIGLTNSTVHKRFNNKKIYPYNIKTIKLYKLSPSEAFDKELYLHRTLAKFTYIPNLYFQGFTECFTVDCLNYIVS